MIEVACFYVLSLCGTLELSFHRLHTQMLYRVDWAIQVGGAREGQLFVLKIWHLNFWKIDNKKKSNSLCFNKKVGALSKREHNKNNWNEIWYSTGVSSFVTVFNPWISELPYLYIRGLCIDQIRDNVYFVKETHRNVQGNLIGLF